MNIDWVELSRVVPYGGVAIVFGLFVAWLLDRQDKRDKVAEELRGQREVAREKARQEAIARQDRKDAERDERFLRAMSDRDARFSKAFSDLAKDWQDALSADRTKQAETGVVVGRELERLAALVSLTNVLLERHDQWERAVWDSSRQRRTGDTGPLPPAYQRKDPSNDPSQS